MRGFAFILFHAKAVEASHAALDAVEGAGQYADAAEASVASAAALSSA